ncbi:MAG: DNA-deoxyinosine glycosylase [Lachnospiraceae bacterium]|nr:DNA-deoxyinosine glycosylase [Lachnospiraceae bacterium]
MSKKTGEYQHLEHEFPPVFDKNSRILILGSFPSMKSREQQFYYGHPQNRFWKILSTLMETDIPTDTDGRRSFLLAHGIALWDVIDSCEIIGSSDSSIRNVQVTDLRRILEACEIRKIYVNGKTAGRLFDKYQKNTYGRESICLPSTSPANAAYSLERLIRDWSCIMDELK